MTRIISIVGGLQPTAPTIGTATVVDATSATVAFTASSYIGKGTITYTATSSPGGLTGTSATSPITVSGLTTGTAYTFTVVGNTNYGVASVASAASNSITPAASGDFESIASVLLTSNAAQINFTSIPNTYKHLQIRGMGRVIAPSTGQTDGQIQVGSSNTIDTGSNYARQDFGGFSSTPFANSSTGTSNGFVWVLPRDGEGAGEYYPFLIDILDYADTNKKKMIRSLTGGSFADANSIIYFASVLYNSTDAINCIRFSSNSQFTDKTEVALFGIKG
jgi:hypothetical protein